ncbi:MAG: hypothetical protein P8Z80_02280, partial [Pseudolabrys sp.]
RAPLVAARQGVETTRAVPSYRRRWTNGRAYYQDNSLTSYDDRPPPPPPDYVPQRRYYRAGGNEDADNGPPAPFPFFLFGQ